MSDDKNAAKGGAKDAAKDAAKDGAAPAAKPKNKKMLVIIIAAAVLLLGGGAAAYFVLRPAPAAAEDGKEAKGGKEGKDGDKAKGEKGKGEKGKGEKGKDEKGKKPVFVDLDMFTVNMKDPEKFLQIKLTFQVAKSEQAEELKDVMPLVRSAVIPVLSQQDPVELATPEGKEKLCVQVAEAANKSLAATELADAIDAALITHMIIQ
jgi:flagellar FliL protein